MPQAQPPGQIVIGASSTGTAEGPVAADLAAAAIPSATAAAPPHLGSPTVTPHTGPEVSSTPAQAMSAAAPFVTVHQLAGEATMEAGLPGAASAQAQGLVGTTAFDVGGAAVAPATVHATGTTMPLTRGLGISEPGFGLS